MAEKRNLTIQLDAEIIRKARVLAAERSTSISQLVAGEVERMVGQREAYAAARQRALQRMTSGFNLGGPPYPKREELHER